jgi:hypothetical protein
LDSWVAAARRECSGNDVWFEAPVDVPADFCGSIDFEVRLVEGDQPVAQWSATAIRKLPPCRRLDEARLALVGGVVFAQKFRYSSVLVGLAGIALSVVLKVPVGVPVGVIEAGVLYLMSDSYYYRKLQRPGRWW